MAGATRWYCEFHPEQNLASIISTSSTFSIWNTKTNECLLGHVPSSINIGSYSCLNWQPTCSTICVNEHVQDLDQPSPKRRKKVRQKTLSNKSGTHLILGTRTGDVVLLNTATNSVERTLSRTHHSPISAVVCSSDGTHLYACSSDAHIFQWVLLSGTLKSQWQSGQKTISAVAISPCARLLVTASKLLRLWSTRTKTLLASFVAHTSLVRSIRFIHFDQSSNNSSSTSSLPGCNDNSDTNLLASSFSQSYLITASDQDRTISVWSLSSAGGVNVCSLSLATGTALHVSECYTPDDPTVPTSVAVSTSGHAIEIFTCLFNGVSSKPLSASLTIRLANEAVPSKKLKNKSKGRRKSQRSNEEGDDEVESPHYLPILSSAFVSGSSELILAYGPDTKPVFEVISQLKDKVGTLVLSRLDPSKVAVAPPAGGTGAKEMVPGYPRQPHIIAADHQLVPTKPLKEGVEPEMEMTLEEALKKLSSISRAGGGEAKEGGGKTSAKSLALLLSQGLQSGDEKIINNILQNRDLHIIKTTVQQLPGPQAYALFSIISKRICTASSQQAFTQCMWLRAVITAHSNFLRTCCSPDITFQVAALKSKLALRTCSFSRFLRLNAQVKSVLEQINPEVKETIQVPSTTVFIDASSDSDNQEDDIYQKTDFNDGDDFEASDEDAAGNDGAVNAASRNLTRQDNDDDDTSDDDYMLSDTV